MTYFIHADVLVKIRQKIKHIITVDKKIQIFMVHILYSRLLPLYSDAEKNAHKILSQLFSPNQSMQLQ